ELEKCLISLRKKPPNKIPEIFNQPGSRFPIRIILVDCFLMFVAVSQQLFRHIEVGNKFPIVLTDSPASKSRCRRYCTVRSALDDFYVPGKALCPAGVLKIVNIPIW